MGNEERRLEIEEMQQVAEMENNQTTSTTNLEKMTINQEKEKKENVQNERRRKKLLKSNTFKIKNEIESKENTETAAESDENNLFKNQNNEEEITSKNLPLEK